MPASNSLSEPSGKDSIPLFQVPRTLTGIPMLSDHGNGLPWRSKSGPPHSREYRLQGYRLFLLHTVLEDREQFALKRSVMSLGPPAETVYQLRRHLLD